MVSRLVFNRFLPEQSCGCQWGAAVEWVEGQSEVEPGAVAVVAVEMDRAAGYGWTGRLQMEDRHQD